MAIANKSIFVDTSGWAAYLNELDPAHMRFLQIFQARHAAQQTFITTNYIFAELVPLLTKRMHAARSQILAIIDTLKILPFVTIIHIDEATDAAAWAMLKQYTDKAWSLVDASSFVVMRNLGLSEALTTDHHFSQVGFVRLPTSEN